MAKAKVYPTEDPAKVRQALLNVFPGAELEEGEGEIVARAGQLDHFMELVRRQRILDATRAELVRGIEGCSTRISLNKQVAYVGKVTMAEGNIPLGNIDICIEADDILSLIDRIAPRTVDGEVVG